MVAPRLGPNTDTDALGRYGVGSVIALTGPVLRLRDNIISHSEEARQLNNVMEDCDNVHRLYIDATPPLMMMMMMMMHMP